MYNQDGCDSYKNDSMKADVVHVHGLLRILEYSWDFGDGKNYGLQYEAPMELTRKTKTNKRALLR